MIPESGSAVIDSRTQVAAHDLAPFYLQASAPERKAAGETD